MALRLGDYVARGELDNRRGYETNGWLELRGSGEILRIELMGDMSEDLAGKRVRFECTESEYGSMEKRSAKKGQFPDRFVGATAMMTADHRVKLFDCPIDEFYQRCKLGEPAPTFWRRCLYFEWYGNGGRALVEMPDATVWIVEGDGEEEHMLRLPDITEGPEWEARMENQVAASLEVVEIEQLDDERMRVTRSQISDEADGDVHDDAKDPYSLFSDDFRKLIGESNEGEGELLEEFLRMEDIWEGKGDQLGGLIGPAPDWEALSDDEIERALKTAVGKMGLYNIAYHVCEHMTPRIACRYLFKTLADCEVHPKMGNTSWFSHFSTTEGCPMCGESFEREEADRKTEGENEDQ